MVQMSEYVKTGIAVITQVRHARSQARMALKEILGVRMMPVMNSQARRDAVVNTI